MAKLARVRSLRVLSVAAALAAWMAMGCSSSSSPKAESGPDASEGGTAKPDSGKLKSDAGDAGTPDAAASPFVWYVLDETTGTKAHDSSSHHFDIDVPGITWNQGGIFDGMSTCGYVTVGPQYGDPPITISAWLTPAARTDEPNGYALQPYPANVLSDDIPGIGGYAIGLNVWSAGSAVSAEGVLPCIGIGAFCAANTTQNAASADAGGSGFSCTSPSSCNQGFNAGTEYLVTLTVDAPTADETATTGQVYINGALFDQDGAGVAVANSMPTLYLGCSNLDTGYGTTRFFDGRARDVRAYLRQLTAAEVKQLYVSGPTLHAPAMK
jgi:hypothetical protein